MKTISISVFDPSMSFYQIDDFILPQTARIQSLNEKFHMRGNEAWKDRGLNGLCLGLSTMYMCQVAQGGFDKGGQFLYSLKSLSYLVNKNSNDQPDFYHKIEIASQNQHAEAKLNEVLSEIIYWHGFMNDQEYTFCDLSDCNAILSQYNNEPMKDKDFHAFFNNLYQATIENNQNLKHVKCHKDLFLAWESECLNAGIRTKNEIIEQFEKVQIMIRQNYFSDQVNILSDRGINAHPCYPNCPFNSLYITANNLIEAINYFALSNSFVFVDILTHNHAMMLAVEVEPQTGNKLFSFFDPNCGVYYYDNTEDLKLLLACFAKHYQVKESIDGELVFGTRFYTKSNKDSDYQRHNFIKREKVDLTILNRLIEAEETVKLTDKVSIKYLDYDKVNNLAELRLTNHGRLFNDNKLIFIDNLSPDQINQYVEKNYEKLLAVPTEKIYLGKDESNFGNFSILPVSDESELLHIINKRKAIDVNSIGLMV